MLFLENIISQKGQSRMLFFDRRSGKNRRADKHTEKDKDSKDQKLIKRSNQDRRSGKDRRSDKYHQLRSDRRKIIDDIIDLLEKEYRQ